MLVIGNGQWRVFDWGLGVFILKLIISGN